MSVIFQKELEDLLSGVRSRISAQNNVPQSPKKRGAKKWCQNQAAIYWAHDYNQYTVKPLIVNTPKMWTPDGNTISRSHLYLFHYEETIWGVKIPEYECFCPGPKLFISPRFHCIVIVVNGSSEGKVYHSSNPRVPFIILLKETCLYL